LKHFLHGMLGLKLLKYTPAALCCFACMYGVQDVVPGSSGRTWCLRGGEYNMSHVYLVDTALRLYRSILLVTAVVLDTGACDPPSVMS
jgi:hypothetical protein